jgi:predicted transcriptional regulator
LYLFPFIHGPEKVDRIKKMNLTELTKLIDGKFLAAADQADREVIGCCGADLMSDVLASIQPNALLLTGLCNPQVVRTAEMADVTAIVLVRGKLPPKETIDLANQEHIPLITSPFGMFDLCGRLFRAGLPSMETPVTTNQYACGE